MNLFLFIEKAVEWYNDRKTRIETNCALPVVLMASHERKYISYYLDEGRLCQFCGFKKETWQRKNKKRKE